MSDWRESKKLGLSKQSFDALISTNRDIADLSFHLLNEGYKYVPTGRLQTDPLERRFSQYMQMSGGRSSISFNFFGFVNRKMNILLIQVPVRLDHGIPESKIRLIKYGPI